MDSFVEKHIFKSTIPIGLDCFALEVRFVIFSVKCVLGQYVYDPFNETETALPCTKDTIVIILHSMPRAERVRP